MFAEKRNPEMLCMFWMEMEIFSEESIIFAK